MLATVRTRLAGVGFVLPATAFLAATVGWPLWRAVSTSFYRSDLLDISSAPHFIGLGNYREVLADPRFRSAVLHTLVFTFAAVTVELVLGLGIALLLRRVVLGQRLLVTLLLIPSMLMPIAVGLIWRFMLNDEYGLIAYYLNDAHLVGPSGLVHDPLLVHAWSSMVALVITDVWEWTPFMSLVLLAGLLSLPREPFEAARVDGASALQEFVHVTAPLLARAIAVALLIRIADAMRVLDIVSSLTAGGPGNSTETVQLYTYHVGFQSFHTGLAYAQIVLITLVTLAVCSVIYVRVAADRRGG